MGNRFVMQEAPILAWSNWEKASFTKRKNHLPHGSGMYFREATGTETQQIRRSPFQEPTLWRTRKRERSLRNRPKSVGGRHCWADGDVPPCGWSSEVYCPSLTHSAVLIVFVDSSTPNKALKSLMCLFPNRQQTPLGQGPGHIQLWSI